MTFDFFNTSDLAFGGKLTSAFKQLFNLLQQAEDNIDSVLEKQAIYSDYFFKNYIVGEPTNATQPCRTNEILNIIQQKQGAINVSTQVVDAGLMVTVKANLYDKVNNTVTSLIDTFTVPNTDFRGGIPINGTTLNQYFLRKYVYIKLADNNMSMIVNANFTDKKKEELEDGEFLLFILNVNPVGDYTLEQLDPRFKVSVGDFSSYRAIKLKDGNFAEINHFIYQGGKNFDVEKDIVLGIKLKAGDKLIINNVTRYDLTSITDSDLLTPVYINFKKGDKGEFTNKGDRVELHARSILLNYVE